jgi:hypothetical protein
MAAASAVTAAEPAPKAALPFAVVADGAPASWIPSGYMGETGSIAQQGDCSEQPHSGRTCTKVTYSKGDGWGGVVWQHPANDWGEAAGGFNLSGAKRLVLWARGAEGGEKVKFGFGVIGSDKPFADTGKAEEEVVLTTAWTEYSIAVADRDLSRVKTGFMWVVGGQGKPLTFFLDDVRWE